MTATAVHLLSQSWARSAASSPDRQREKQRFHWCKPGSASDRQKQRLGAAVKQVWS